MSLFTKMCLPLDFSTIPPFDADYIDTTLTPYGVPASAAWMDTDLTITDLSDFLKGRKSFQVSANLSTSVNISVTLKEDAHPAPITRTVLGSAAGNLSWKFPGTTYACYALACGNPDVRSVDFLDGNTPDPGNVNPLMFTMTFTDNSGDVTPGIESVPASVNVGTVGVSLVYFAQDPDTQTIKMSALMEIAGGGTADTSAATGAAAAFPQAASVGGSTFYICTGTLESWGSLIAASPVTNYQTSASETGTVSGLGGMLQTKTFYLDYDWSTFTPPDRVDSSGTTVTKFTDIAFDFVDTH